MIGNAYLLFLVQLSDSVNEAKADVSGKRKQASRWSNCISPALVTKVENPILGVS